MPESVDILIPTIVVPRGIKGQNLCNIKISQFEFPIGMLHQLMSFEVIVDTVMMMMMMMMNKRMTRNKHERENEYTKMGHVEDLSHFERT